MNAVPHTEQEHNSFAAEIETVIGQEFAVDLDPARVRQRLATRHPMLDGHYLLDTDETESFCDVVFDHVVARKSGLYICGSYRIGKTKAIERSIERLALDLPHLAALRYNGERKPNQSKESFCKDLLIDFGYDVRPRMDHETVLERYLLTRAAAAGGFGLVLFIDEAQMLSVLHYRYLLEIWNALRMRRCTLVTVLVGQEGLVDLKALTGALDHGAVVARFFVKPYVMGGMKSATALKAYLKNFDVQLHYPLQSDWSYSRFFLRAAFDKGWRLSGEADTMWKALGHVSEAKPAKVKTKGYRLAFISDSIHAFLLDAMRDDQPRFSGSFERWCDAVLAAAQPDMMI